MAGLGQALLLQPVGQGACRVQELKLYYGTGRDDACGEVEGAGACSAPTTESMELCQLAQFPLVHGQVVLDGCEPSAP